MFEPAYPDPASADGVGGDRLIIATGTDVRVAQSGQLEATRVLAAPGAIAVAVDPQGHWVVIGSTDGTISRVSSSALDVLGAGATPVLESVERVSRAVKRIWSIGGGRIAVLDASDTLTAFEVSTGALLSSIKVPGLRDVMSFGPADRHLAILALPSGISTVDTSTMGQVQGVGLDGGATSAVVLEGGDQIRRDRNFLQMPTIYVATGIARIATFTIADDGMLTAAEVFPMPGPITDLRWNRPTI